MSVKEVERLTDVSGLKSYDLDPIPARILKGCKSTLLPTLTSIVNLSLQSACMPGQLKEAMVRQKLKNESLDFEQYSNFAPISNLKLVSKIIERAVAVQVKDYITDNDLDESLQSAYKHLHSTETALLIVHRTISFVQLMITSVLRSFCWTCLVHLTPLITNFSWIDCAIALVLEDKS